MRSGWPDRARVHLFHERQHHRPRGFPGGPGVVRGRIYSGLVLGLFVAGVAAGEAIESRTGRQGPSVVLALEAMFLAAGAALNPYGVAEQHAVFAGFRYGTAERDDAPGGRHQHRPTYVTGTLVQIGRGLAGGGTGPRVNMARCGAC